MKSSYMRHYSLGALLCVVLLLTVQYLSGAISMKEIYPSDFCDEMMVEGDIMVTMTAANDYYGYLKVYDAQTANSQEEMASLYVPYRYPHSCKMYQSHVYVPDHWGMYIRRYSLLNPASPVLNYEYNWSMVGVRDFTFQDDIMLVATQNIGLRIVDIHSENSAEELSDIQDGNPFFRVWAYQDKAYVLSYNLSTEDAVIKLIDFSNPNSPYFAGTIELPDFDYDDDTELVFYQNYVHVVRSYTPTRVYSLATPGQPLFLDTLENGMNYCNFLNDQRIMVQNNILKVDNFTEPTEPQELATYELPVYNSNPLLVDWPYVYVKAGVTYCLDLSELNPPTEIVYSYDTGLNGSALEGYQDWVYLRGKALRLDNMGDVAEETVCPALSNVTKLKVDGDRLHSPLGSYMGCGVWSLSQPGSPEELFTITGYCEETFMGGDYLYTLYDGCIKCYDVSVSGAGSFLSLIEGSFYTIAVSGNTLWALSYNELCSYDLSNPLEPVLLTILPLTEILYQTPKLTLQGDYLFVTGYLGQIRIIDVSDPGNPVLSGRALLPEQYDCCSVPPVFTTTNRMVLASANFNQIIFYDMADPNAPEYQSHFSLPYRVSKLVSYQDRVYFKRNDKLLAFPVPEPSGVDDPITPVPTARISCYPNPFSVQASIKVEIENTSLDSSRPSALDIYNLKGQKIRTLSLCPGTKELSWDGCDQSGQPCANGIYLLKLNVGRVRGELRKVTLLRN